MNIEWKILSDAERLPDTIVAIGLVNGEPRYSVSEHRSQRHRLFYAFDEEELRVLSSPLCYSIEEAIADAP